MIKVLKFFNLAFFILMICVNALANIMPLGHGNTGSISKKYENLFTPAPITFSIWGLIYLLVFVFILYQLGVFGNHMLAECLVSLAGPWFIISCIFNIGWLISWHYEKIELSMLMMVLLLITLIILVSRLSFRNVLHASGLPKVDILAKLSIYAFELYIGWITAATIANASVLLVKRNWNKFGLSSQFWTVVVILVGALLGVLFIITKLRYMSAAAIIWAYCGILIKHISQSGYAGKYPSIIVASIISIVVILAAGTIMLILSTGEPA